MSELKGYFDRLMSDVNKRVFVVDGIFVLSPEATAELEQLGLLWDVTIDEEVTE